MPYRSYAYLVTHIKSKNLGLQGEVLKYAGFLDGWRKASKYFLFHGKEDTKLTLDPKSILWDSEESIINSQTLVRKDMMVHRLSLQFYLC